ncbi:MAG: hypothetical protein Q9167_004879 [Letrouitia subvulpina]
MTLLSDKSQKLDPKIIPQGWSADTEDLEHVAEGFPKAMYGIDEIYPVNPVIAIGDCSPRCLLECPQGTFYIWNELSHGVWKILKPEKVEEIVPKLNDPALTGIEFKRMEVKRQKVADTINQQGSVMWIRNRQEISHTSGLRARVGRRSPSALALETWVSIGRDAPKQQNH